MPAAPSKSSASIGLPAPQKTEGPSTCMPILRIEEYMLRLPTDKTERLKTSIEDKTQPH